MKDGQETRQCVSTSAKVTFVALWPLKKKKNVGKSCRDWRNASHCPLLVT